jgi:hypothetical protein
LRSEGCRLQWSRGLRPLLDEGPSYEFGRIRSMKLGENQHLRKGQPA